MGVLVSQISQMGIVDEIVYRSPFARLHISSSISDAVGSTSISLIRSPALSKTVSGTDTVSPQQAIWSQSEVTSRSFLLIGKFSS